MRRLAVHLFWVAGPLLAVATTSSAAEPKRGLEWTVWAGGVTSLGVPPVADGWSFSQTIAQGSVSVDTTASARYKPGSALGGNGGGQLWLPLGLGFFAEYEKRTQDLKSEIALDITARIRGCPTCPSNGFTLEGRLGTEIFERDDRRLHLGLGYRLRLPRDMNVEITGGATRVSVRQELVRTLLPPEPMLDPDFFCLFTSGRCPFKLSVKERETAKGSTWGLNIGGGATKFLSKLVGVTAEFRYSKAGDVEFSGFDAIDRDGRASRTRVKVRTGAFVAGAGLKLRF